METTTGWIPLDEFCEKYQVRRGTASKRAMDGVWERGVIYSCPDGGAGYIHEARAVAWLKEHGKLST